MTKGWKRENARHSLARKGIKTGRKRKGILARIQGAQDKNQYLMMEDKLEVLKEEKEILIDKLKDPFSLKDKEEIKSIIQMKMEDIEKVKADLKEFRLKYDVDIKPIIAEEPVPVEEEHTSPLAVFAETSL